MSGITTRLALSVGATALIVSATGCQQQTGPTNVATLDEAKQLTANFSGGDASMPPRTIDDILSLLDSAPVSESLAKEQAQAAAPVPSGASDGDLAEFYYDRGVAAYDVGRSAQALQDFDAALPLAIKAFGNRGAYWKDDRNYYERAAWTEYDFGDVAKAMKLLTEMRNYAENNHDRLFDVGNWIIALADAGHLSEAETQLPQFESLLSADESPTAWSRYKAEEVPAYLASAKGDREEAEKHFRKVLELRGTLNQDQFVYYYARSDFAQALLAGGDPLAAEVEARQGIREDVQDVGSGSILTGYTVQTLANVLVAEGRTGDAGQLLDRAVASAQKGGVPDDAPTMLGFRLSLAEVYAAQSRWKEAADIYRKVEADRPKGGISNFEATFETSAYPLALIKTGDFDGALKVASARYDRASENAGKNSYDAAEAALYRAIAIGEKGDQAQALQLFRANLPSVAQRSRQLTQSGQNEAAAARLDQFVGYYLKYLWASGGVANADEAFQAADIARGHSVDSALNDEAARSHVGSPELQDLARREQDALNQIGALSSLLAGKGIDDASATDLRKRIDDLRGARGKLMEEIEARFPDYAALINPKAPKIADVQAALKPGEAVVAVFVGDDQSYAWAFSKSGAPAFASVNLKSAEVAKDVGVLRTALNPDVSTLGDIPAFDVATSHKLYQAFLEPVSAGWKDAKTLIVVPHKSLGQIPFGLLATADATVDQNATPLFSGYAAVPWLVKDHAVATIPSASALVALRKLPPAGASRQPLAAFADPVFNPQEAEQVASAAQAPDQPADASLTARGIEVRGMPLHVRAAPKTRGVSSADLAELPALPDTAAEAKGIALSMKADAASVFLGLDANEEKVESMDLSNRRVVVFATHGLVPGDLNGLYEPALALSSPSLSKTKGDGLLTMGEILNLKLDADWVVLSACNTASGSGEGSEAISGLGRAFFYAGARALMVTNWPVETTSAKLLTTGTFAAETANVSGGKAEALRQSELKLVSGPGFQADGKTVYSYAHPIFWAPFSMIGDPD